MNRFFELVNLSDKEQPKTYFFEQRTGNDICGYIQAVMERFNNYDIKNYRLYEHETKTTWQAKQDEMKAIFNNYMCYFVNKAD